MTMLFHIFFHFYRVDVRLYRINQNYSAIGGRGGGNGLVGRVNVASVNVSMELLSNDNTICTHRKQKFIGTRKHNSEATAITKHAKDSDASSSDSHIKETQGTSFSMSGDGDEQSSQPCGQGQQYDSAGRDVEPRSYRDVVVNG